MKGLMIALVIGAVLYGILLMISPIIERISNYLFKDPY